jgi:hypothetical protein
MLRMAEKSKEATAKTTRTQLKPTSCVEHVVSMIVLVFIFVCLPGSAFARGLPFVRYLGRGTSGAA